MAKQTSTENISIIRKHTWQVPFRISMYEIEDGRKFVLLEGGKHMAAALTRTSLTSVNMELNGVKQPEAVKAGEVQKPTNAHPPLQAAFGHAAGPSR